MDQAAAPGRVIHLVADDTFLAAIGGRLPADIGATPLRGKDPAGLVDAAARGDTVVWIGDGDRLPPALWVGAFAPSQGGLDCTPAEHSPLLCGALPFRQAPAQSAYLKPPKELPLHNVDEEPRADFLPVLEARDRFGQVVGYPGVLVAHYAPSFVGRRFEGAECFAFLFPRPLAAMPADGWLALLRAIAHRARAGVQIRRVTTDYACYRAGERLRVTATVANRGPDLVAVDARFLARGPGERDFRPLATLRRAPDAGSTTEAVCDVPAPAAPGLWTLRVEACIDPERATRPALRQGPAPVDRRDIAVVVAGLPVRTPRSIAARGPALLIDGRPGFWTGTHYYPSSSWWEWAWRDFRPLLADEHLRGMRRTGYRLVRVWVDPALDEQNLRAMDALIALASRAGLVLDVCVFSQWPRRLSFEGPDGRRVEFEFRGPRDLNVFGISLRNLGLQKQYLGVLAKRWRGAGNIVWNLANETYVRDPDAAQMDPAAAAWEGIPDTPGALRDTLLFRRWAREMTGALREAGARQPVIAGYLFSTLGGGDSYLGNRDADIAVWHSYLPPPMTGSTLQVFDPSCSGRPLLLEEMGAAGWNDAAAYDAHAHYALAAGAAACLSYEWGVGWLAPEMSYSEASFHDALAPDPDPRWFAPAPEIARLWPEHGIGTFPAASGYHYGSAYHATPFPAEAAAALGRIGRLADGLAPARRPERAYVVVPTAFAGERTCPAAVLDAFQALWEEKAEFGVLQEDCLDQAPPGVRVLIVPAGVSPPSEPTLERLQRAGVQVLGGPAARWRGSGAIPRVPVAPGGGVHALVRRTRSGTLYSLFAEPPARVVTLGLKRGHQVTLGLDRYGLIHAGPGGLLLVEAAGEVTADGKPILTVGRGRAVLASADGDDLTRARRVRLLAAGPTTVRFARPIARAVALQERRADPLGTVEPAAQDPCALTVDDQLARYVLELTFR